MSKLQCPECNSDDTKVYRTVSKPDSIIRYHKCNICDHKFKSVQTYEDYVAILKRIKWEVRNI